MADHGRVRAARSVTNLAPYPPNQPDPFELTLSAPRPTRWTATEGIGSSPPVRRGGIEINGGEAFDGGPKLSGVQAWLPTNVRRLP